MRTRRSKLPIFLFFTLFLVQPIFTDDLVFVFPGWICNSGGCSGTSTNPMNNLFDAFELATHSLSAQVILLYNASAPDYYLMMNSTSSNSYLNFVVKKLTIRPLFCNDNIITTHLSTMCFQPQQKAKIILKTTQFSFIINETLTIKNVILDALEDIKLWNENSSQLDNCLYNSKKCCQEGQQMSVLSQSGGSVPLWCEWHGNSSQLPTTSSSSSLFVMRSSNDTSLVKSLIFENTEFLNFQSPQLQSLIQLTHSPSNLTFNQTKINRIYFDSGVISSNIDLNDLAMPSSIIVQDSSFSNYNIWNILHPSGSTSKREGYFLNAQGLYKGILQIIRSTFMNSTSSLRNSCWSQTSQPSHYNLPMNNLLTSQPRSRTNLWKQYHQESYQNQNNEYVSSLVLISNLDGDVIISDSTFKNIIGTSGSALRINDVSSADASFTISNTSFDSNFAFDRFANIMIVRSSDPFFSSIVDCPVLDISKSNFTNTYGCPGAYGNVLYLCYLDAQPSEGSSLSNYSLGTKTNDFLSTLTSLSNQEENEALYAIKVKDSLFQNNLLAVSNSLAIIGAYSALFLRNIFQDNGGTTAEIAQVSLQGSYFLSRYPTGVTFPLPLTHFGQSSAVYLDHFIKIYSKGNVYQRNWGPWEGSLSLGCSITIKNWIRVKDGLKFNEDAFVKHTGIPARMVSALANQNLANNVYMDPIVTISLDIEGNSALLSVSPNFDLIGPVSVLLQGAKFENNFVNYNYNPITYNKNEISSLISNTISTNSRYQTGLIKILMTTESRDDFSYGFKTYTDYMDQGAVLALQGGEIRKNKLESVGCLFVNAFFLEGVKITENEIYLAGETYTSSAPYDPSYFGFIESKNQGLLCIRSMDLIGSFSKFQMSVNNLYVSNNKGVIINTESYTEPRVYVTNSVFVNNIIHSFGIFLIRPLGIISSINNLFIKNDNSLGIICSLTEPTIVTIFNVYLANIGRQATIISIDINMIVPLYEVLAKVYWNYNVWDYMLYYDNMIAQSGLYYISYSRFIIISSEFSENPAYTGLINGVGGFVTIYNSKITNNYVEGVSIIGTFSFITDLIIKDTLFANNTLVRDPLLTNTPTGMLIFLTGTVTMQNVQMVNGTTENGAHLFFSNILSGVIENTTLKNFTAKDISQSPLIYGSSTELKISNFTCSHTTSIFDFVESSISFEQISFEDLISESTGSYLFNFYGASIIIKDLAYRSSLKETSSVPLISGDGNDLVLDNLKFYGNGGGLYKIFSLRNSGNLILTDSFFDHLHDMSERTVLELISSKTIVIEKCTFIYPGTVLQATETKDRINFVANTILTESYQQSILLEQSTQIYLQQNYFLGQSNNKALLLPGSQVYIANLESLVVLKDNVFNSLYGGNGIFSLGFQQFPSKAQSINNVFINNNGSSGGAIYIKTEKNWTSQAIPEVLVENSVFLLNKANTQEGNFGRGGALFQTTPDQTQQNITLNQSLFIRNTADKGGGAIYFDYLPPSVDQTCKFIENFAQRLNHIASYPVRITSYDSESDSINASYVPGTQPPECKQEEDFYRWEGLVSGIAMATTRKFILLDMFGQIVYDEDTSLLGIFPNGFSEITRDIFSPTLSIHASGGLYTLENLEFNYRVGEKLNVTFKSTAVPSFRSPNQNLVLLPSVKVEMSFDMCSMGQFAVVTEEYSVCQECPINFWQLNPSTAASACNLCDTGSTICSGGNNVGPKKGYWRMNKTADIVLPCPRKQSCLGNEDKGAQVASEQIVLDSQGKCAQNYFGNLCFDCMSGWARNNENTCIDCLTDVGSYIIILGFLILQGISITYAVLETFKVTTADISHPNSASLFRVFINYSQTFYILILMPLDWPKVFTDILGIITKIITVWDDIFSMGCLFTALSENFGIRMIFIESLFFLIRPFIYILFASMFWIMVFRISKQPISYSNQDLKNKIITTIVVICFYTQASIIQRSLSLFECTNLYRNDSPLYYFSHDYELKCWEKEHLSWALGLAVPSIVIWVICLPGLLFYILKKNRLGLQRTSILQKFVFIYNSYKPKRYYWEYVMIVRRILFILVSLFVDQFSKSFQIFLFMALVFIFLWLQVTISPYSSLVMNNLERASLISLTIVSICGMYFQIIDNGVLDQIFIVAGVLGYLYFFVHVGRIFLEFQFEKISQDERGAQIISVLKKKILCCLKPNNSTKPLDIYKSEPATPRSFESESDLRSVSDVPKSSLISDQNQMDGENQDTNSLMNSPKLTMGGLSPKKMSSSAKLNKGTKEPSLRYSFTIRATQVENETNSLLVPRSPVRNLRPRNKPPTLINSSGIKIGVNLDGLNSDK